MTIKTLAGCAVDRYVITSEKVIQECDYSATLHTVQCHDTVNVVKGIVTIFNIFLWHESEDINEKSLFSKLSVDSNFTFSSYA